MVSPGGKQLSPLRRPILFALALGVILFSAVAPALGAAPPGAQCAVIADNSHVLAWVGFIDWGGSWDCAGPGSQVYAPELQVYLYSLTGQSESFTVTTYEEGGWLSPIPITVEPGSGALLTVPFYQDTSWNNVTVYFGPGGANWQGSVAFPKSLLPTSLINVGGEDLFVMLILSETLICFAGATQLAKWLQTRKGGIWAPHFSLVIWAHVLLVGLAGIVLVFYAFVDQVFSGTSPLIYPICITPMFFIWALQHFNSSERVEIVRTIARPGGQVAYLRWLVRVGKTASGSLILVGEKWGDLLARWCGRYPTLDTADPLKPELFAAEVYNLPSPTGTRPWEGDRSRALERFKVVNPQEDQVTRIMIAQSSDPVKVTFPRLTIHRSVTVPAKLSPEGNVIVPEHSREKLTWPHFTSVVEPVFHLAPVHYMAAEAVKAGWLRAEDLADALAKVETAFHALQGRFHGEVHAEKEASLAPYYRLRGRTPKELSERKAAPDPHEQIAADTLRSAQ